MTLDRYFYVETAPLSYCVILSLNLASTIHYIDLQDPTCDGYPFLTFDSPFDSCRSKPLQIWDKKVRNGHIKRITDPDIQSSVLEIMGTNVSTTFIQCPADPKKTLAIKLPFLVMIIKNVRLLMLPQTSIIGIILIIISCVSYGKDSLPI